jgi:hypothetical protein
VRFQASIEFLRITTNLYASNLELGTIPPGFVHQLGRSRWVIDPEVFQTITTDGHLKKPSVHQGRGHALLVLTMIRVLAKWLGLASVRPVRFGGAACTILPRVQFRVAA